MTSEREFERLWRLKYGNCKTMAEIISKSCESANVKKRQEKRMQKRWYKLTERDEHFIRGYKSKPNEWLIEQLPHMPEYLVLFLARKWRKVNE